MKTPESAISCSCTNSPRSTKLVNWRLANHHNPIPPSPVATPLVTVKRPGPHCRHCLRTSAANSQRNPGSGSETAPASSLVSALVAWGPESFRTSAPVVIDFHIMTPKHKTDRVIQWRAPLPAPAAEKQFERGQLTDSRRN